MHHGRRGPSLADRAARSGIPPSAERPRQSPADPGRDGSSAGGGHGRHCWVRDPPDALGIWPGLLVEWRLLEDGWHGRVAYTLVGDHGPLLVEVWLPADHLKVG